MDGHPDRVCLVTDGAVDRLSNPPHRVRGELRAPPPVEALGGADEAERALLDQVKERHAAVPVRASDDDYEAEIRPHHAILRCYVACLDPLCQPDLLGRREEAVPANLT